MSEEKTEAVEATENKKKNTKKKKPQLDSKAISVAEMQKRGWFQEMNRTIFHPLGLEIQQVRDGKGSAFIIVDLVDNIATNEIKYGGTIADGSAIKNVESFQKFTRERNGLRKKLYGRVVQSVK
jgi:hypothetical protein